MDRKHDRDEREQEFPSGAPPSRDEAAWETEHSGGKGRGSGPADPAVSQRLLEMSKTCWFQPPRGLRESSSRPPTTPLPSAPQTGLPDDQADSRGLEEAWEGGIPPTGCASASFKSLFKSGFLSLGNVLYLNNSYIVETVYEA